MKKLPEFLPQYEIEESSQRPFAVKWEELMGWFLVPKQGFVAQLTDTHCRYLAAMWKDGDTKNYITFLDGDIFMDNWGFGKDNCGNETSLLPKGH